MQDKASFKSRTAKYKLFSGTEASDVCGFGITGSTLTIRVLISRKFCTNPYSGELVFLTGKMGVLNSH